MAQRVAFIGLGVMGYPMAGHLARAGHHVTVYNRTPAKAVQDPDGKEIVEALLLEWERDADEGRFPGGIRPDVNFVRKLLNLPPPAS